MASFRGSQGEVTIDSTALGELMRWEVTPERPYIDRTRIGDSARSGTLDIPEWSGTLRLAFDYGSTEQATLMDVLVGNSDPPTIAFEGIVDGTGGTKILSGNIIPTSAPVTAEQGSDVEVEFSFNGDGALTISWS